MPMYSDYSGYYFLSGQPITYTFNVGGISRYYSDLNQIYQSRFGSMLETWSSQSDITFQEVSNPSDAQIRVSWDIADDGSDGDGPGGLAVYTQLYNNDEDSIIGNSPDEGADILIDKSDVNYFEKAALIGIGQALGLQVISHTSSVMNTAELDLTSLTNYDISLIQSLYGLPGSGNSGEWRGTDSAETMIGAPNADIIHGDGGADTIYGYAGDDVLYGNKGEDLLAGWLGNDTLYGGQNDGVPSGTPSALRDGTDHLFGSAGNDLLYGNHGGDRLYGSVGDDTIYGGQDDDSINGGSGNDVLFGNLGSDIFQTSSFSDDGQDTIHGFEIGVDFIDKNNDTVAGYSHVDDGFLIDFGRYGSIFLVGISTDDANTLFIF